MSRHCASVRSNTLPVEMMARRPTRTHRSGRPCCPPSRSGHAGSSAGWDCSPPRSSRASTTGRQVVRSRPRRCSARGEDASSSRIELMLGPSRPSSELGSNPAVPRVHRQPIQDHRGKDCAPLSQSRSEACTTDSTWVTAAATGFSGATIRPAPDRVESNRESGQGAAQAALANSGKSDSVTILYAELPQSHRDMRLDDLVERFGPTGLVPRRDVRALGQDRVGLHLASRLPAPVALATSLTSFCSRRSYSARLARTCSRSSLLSERSSEFPMKTSRAVSAMIPDCSPLPL